ncbi:MAG: energy-coupling factor ABC transporter ATP-binding protein [Candidatus Odinarchaeia archaeon]
MIEALNLSYRYPGGKLVLKNINLRIDDGEIVAIMGANGAGKTTLVKHFNGLLKPTEGDVLIDGMNTKKFSIAEISKRVGFVFQNADHQLFSESVEKEIEFTLKNLGFEEEKINEIIEKTLKQFDLVRYRDRSPFSLSGGERKRTALASILCADPKIIILDEPTTGQDAIQKNKLISMIKNLNKLGKTIVIISHDMEFIVDLKPRIITLRKGMIVSDGEANKVLTNRKILSESSLLPPQLTLLSWKLSEQFSFPYNILTVNEFAQHLKKQFK